MNLEQLASLGIDTKWYQPLVDTFVKYGISTTQRQAAFLGQCMHESNNFRALEEDLDYSASALMRVWPSRFPDYDVAEKYAHNPEKIANKVYAGKLGNTEEGDGFKYRGRGVIQLTGKEAYLYCGSNLGIDTISHPEILLEPKWACMSAGWFWNKKGLNTLADASDYKEMTHRINGGMNGYDKRVAKITLAKKALETY